MWQVPWRVFFGFITGLIGLSSVIIYWLFSLRVLLARKGRIYSSYFFVLPWIAILLISLSGLLKISGVIELGSVIDITLLYAHAILNYVGL